MSNKIKITIMVATVIIILTSIMIFSSNSVKGNVQEESIIYKTLYALDGRTLEVPEAEVDTYLNLFWYTEPVCQVYSIDQRSMIIYQREKEAYLDVGWYEAPVMYMYNKLGTAFIIYQHEKQDYINQGYYTEPPSVNYNDMVLLAKVIYAEATQNPNLRIIDRQYVGAVVMNRVRHSRFPNTVRGVIYAPGQYACVGNYWFNQNPPQECLDIAKQLLLGETFGVPSNVVFQAQFTQGKGIWKKVGVHYYCYI